MAMDAAEYWRKCFENWPTDVERRGVIVTNFDEPIGFEAFSTSGDMLLVERRTPDTVGARMVIVPFQNILALKIVDVVKMKSFQCMGFAAPVAPPPRK